MPAMPASTSGAAVFTYASLPSGPATLENEVENASASAPAMAVSGTPLAEPTGAAKSAQAAWASVSGVNSPSA